MHFYESVLEVPVHILSRGYTDFIEILNEIDPTHNESHIMHTCMNAENIIRRFNSLNEVHSSVTPVKSLLIKIAAYFHDIGNILDRDTHHDIGADYVSSIFLYNSDPDYMISLIRSEVINEHLLHVIDSENIHDKVSMENRIQIFLNEFVKDISNAIRRHRASYKGDRNEIESVVAMADRGAPNLEVYLYRSYIYGRTKMGLSINDSIGHSFLHILVEKFGEEGYGFADGLIEKYYPNEYRAFCERRDSLTVKEYKNMVYSLNWENKINDKRSER